jgi:chemotaxis protein methyltransferase CheR
MNIAALSEKEFQQFKKMIYDRAGIALSPAKMPLVSSRLAKRLKQHQLATYGDYFKMITSHANAAELQIAIDLLTTNETHFFREPKHFDFLKSRILASHTRGRMFRAWSAASSSGEEPYTIAMILAECLGDAPWEVVGSDISTRVLEKARTGLYPMERVPEIPRNYLTSYCLKGVGENDGKLLISKQLRERVKFMQINLIQPIPKLGEFDVIFLRNVMIYFDQETKAGVVGRLLPMLKEDGHFFISHSESLNGVTDALRLVAPAVYRKP